MLMLGVSFQKSDQEKKELTDNLATGKIIRLKFAIDAFDNFI